MVSQKPKRTMECLMLTTCFCGNLHGLGSAFVASHLHLDNNFLLHNKIKKHTVINNSKYIQKLLLFYKRGQQATFV